MKHPSSSLCTVACYANHAYRYTTIALHKKHCVEVPMVYKVYGNLMSYLWSLCERHCQSTKYECWIQMGNPLTISTQQPFQAFHVLRSPYKAPIDATKYAYRTAADHLLTMSTVQPLHGWHVLRSPYEAPLDTTRMLTLYAVTFVFLQHTLTSFILHHILQNTHGSNFPNLLPSPYEAPLHTRRATLLT